MCKRFLYYQYYYFDIILSTIRFIQSIVLIKLGFFNVNRLKCQWSREIVEESGETSLPPRSTSRRNYLDLEITTRRILNREVTFLATIAKYTFELSYHVHGQLFFTTFIFSQSPGKLKFRYEDIFFSPFKYILAVNSELF